MKLQIQVLELHQGTTVILVTVILVMVTRGKVITHHRTTERVTMLETVVPRVLTMDQHRQEIRESIIRHRCPLRHHPRHSDQHLRRRVLQVTMVTVVPMVTMDCHRPMVINR